MFRLVHHAPNNYFYGLDFSKIKDALEQAYRIVVSHSLKISETEDGQLSVNFNEERSNEYCLEKEFNLKITGQEWEKMKKQKTIDARIEQAEESLVDAKERVVTAQEELDAVRQEKVELEKS